MDELSTVAQYNTPESPAPSNQGLKLTISNMPELMTLGLIEMLDFNGNPVDLVIENAPLLKQGFHVCQFRNLFS